jgi:PAS domain S-box-containing protein
VLRKYSSKFHSASAWLWTMAIATLVFGLLVTLTLVNRTVVQNRIAIDQHLQLHTDQLAAGLSNELSRHIDIMRQVRAAALREGLQRMSPQAFRRNVESGALLQELPDANSLGLVWRMPAKQAPAFVQAARRSIGAHFSIKQVNASDLAVLTLIEPLQKNHALQGMNMTADSDASAAMQSAMRSDDAVIAIPTTGLAAGDARIFLPIYRPSATIDTEKERSMAIAGWVSESVSLTGILTRLHMAMTLLNFRLEDVSNDQMGVTLFASANEDTAQALYQYQKVESILGRQWRITANPTPKMMTELHLLTANTVLLIGAAISALLTLLVGAAVSLNDRNRRLSAQLDLCNSLFVNSSDAMVIESPDGRVIEWNPQAEIMFGYSATEARGQPLNKLLKQTTPDLDEPDLPQRTISDQFVKPHDTIRCHRDGRSLNIAIASVPIHDKGGRLNAIVRIMRDIRDRKVLELVNANLKLKSANQLMQLNTVQNELEVLINAMPSVVAYLDNDMRIRFANKIASTWFGPYVRNFVGLHLRELLGREGFVAALQYMDDLEAGQTANFEISMPRDQDSQNPAVPMVRHISVRLTPNLVDGRMLGIFAVMHDVTELIEQRERQVELASENFAMLNTLSEHSLISITDRNGNITYANDNFCKISGYDLQELTGENHRIISSGTHSEEFWKSMWNRLSSGNAWRGEMCNRRKDGLLYWVDSIIAPFFDVHGRITKYLAIHFDVSEHKRTQQRIEESETLLKTVEKVSGVGGYSHDLITNKLHWTQQAYRIHDVPFDQEPTLALLRSMMREDIGNFLHDMVADAIASGSPYDLELPMTTRSGREIWVRTSGTVEYQSGRATRMVGAIQDVTERRQYEQNLRDASVKASNASRAKSEFLANMSHEIRTPLNAIIGMGYLLKDTPMDREQTLMLEKMQFASRSLLSVINNVLDLAKIEADEIQLDELDFSLDELFHEIHGMLIDQARQKGIELIMSSVGEASRYLHGDATRLRQILINLTNNAIKFTTAGSVRVTTTMHEGEGRLWLSFAVTDTGSGIEPQALQRLFTPFTQADTTTTRRFGGTGLGLSIARRLARLMGGDITVTSVVGQGSEFCVQLPFTRASRTQQLLGTHSAGAFEVIALQRPELAANVLASSRGLGWNVTNVQNLKSLWETLRKRDRLHWPDALLLDWQCLKDDISSFVQQLRGDFPDHPMPGLVALLDNSVPKDTRQTIVKCVDAVVHLPLESSTLFDAAIAAVKKHEHTNSKLMLSTQTGDMRAQWLCGIRILLADDSDTNLMVARTLMEKQGAAVTTCTDGQQAVEQLRTGATEFDVILMDVQMPIMDGNEATRIIRTELGFTQIPIIALTAGALMTERQQCLNAGMNDFLSKPFDPQTLIRVIRQSVERVRGTALAIAILDKSQDRSFDPGIASIDSQVVQQMFGNDSTLFRTTLRQMLHEYADYALPIQVDLDDFTARKQLQLRMHKLKGSSGLIGAIGVQRIAGALEKSLIENHAADFVQTLLSQLASAMTTLHEEAHTLVDEQNDVVEDIADDTPADHAAMQEKLAVLVKLLENQNLEALDQFEVVKIHLSKYLERSRFETLVDALQRLEFAQVIQLLQAEQQPEEITDSPASARSTG